MSAPAIIAIGLDAADPRLLFALLAEGAMPNLRSLACAGAWGALIAPEAMADDGVWASFATCATPAEHGRYNYLGLVPGSYDPLRFRADSFDRPAFWQYLDRAGKRVAILDVPKCPEAELAHGSAVFDWRVHGVDGLPRSTPPELATGLVDRFGLDPTDRPAPREVFLCHPGPTDPARLDRLFELLNQSVADKTTVSLELIAQRVDLFVTVFKEVHCASHHCWPADSRLKQVFRLLDDAVDRLVETADDSTTVVVFSSGGMDMNHHGTTILDGVLRRLEDRWWSRSDSLVTAADVFYHRARRRLRMPARTSRHRTRRFFPMIHNEIAGAVRINLVGREPSGRVAAAEYTGLCDRLEAEFMCLRNAAPGRPGVARVIRNDRAPSERRSDWLPDLFVVWHRDDPIEAVRSNTVGVVRGARREERIANHVEHGVWIARGPLVRRGEAPACDVIDFGVTFGALCGVAVPSRHGQPIAAIAG
jgi:predicted AlkP superfamily phosphohydrolase/phosphomutase